MVQHVFAVYDSKLGAFLHPFLVPTVQVALRVFSAGSNDPTSQLCRHPEDFTLFQIAEWDDSSGIYRNLDHHVNHGLASQFKERS